MKKSILFFVLLFSWGITHAQQSDYQVVRLFEANYEALIQQAELSATSQQIAQLRDEAVFLFEQYEEHEELVDRALYPRTFDAMMSALSQTLSSSEERLILIESQRDRLFTLNEQVNTFQLEIARLSSFTDSLRKEINKAQTNELQLADMIQTYRNRLEEKDLLIFEMIDSLLITDVQISETMSGEQMAYHENGFIATNGNPISLISSMLDENIQFIQSNPRFLTVKDHLRMTALQMHFEQTWNKVGNDILAVYSGENRRQVEKEMEEKISQWRTVAQESMWTSINDYLEFNDIHVSEFDSRTEFYQALNEFVNQGKKNSEDEFLSFNSYEEYKKLNQFWETTFKTEWNEVIPTKALLSVAQLTSIDEQLTKWESTARPIHPLFTAVLVLLVVTITGFIIVMMRERAVRLR